ncbi:Uncharacterized protein NF27_DP01150 [Candidatus Jidaibacter acanthamoeba]|uniref:DUF2795 domain-containing protein n=1 Tax=Candidatus Jidaibacter acanthamoebae TaxID=86105 RepID=A0A0C1MZS5_9RICK|nr:DUF2795 domain-containing protein [Candidatus Jidaibacter acanthamoeba]KIE05571.1 Uncharacterized protein NF27_DP01150 [Candidatus Jidaibacter acanthamoeba]
MVKDTKDGRVEGGKKTSEGGRGDPEKASPAAVERYLKGIHYPAGKADLEKTAKKNGAPSDVLNVLSRFDDKEYKSPIDIAKEVGNVE